ncbi:MAG: DUF61 family protein [Desulfurococcales archaeon]|nr:DUF61 family protein [Desulfurococcales archaeon]
MAGELRKYVERKYREELRRLSSYWPAEYLTLRELRDGKRLVKLQTGETHALAEDEVERLLEAVPFYFHDLVRIPITLRYEKVGGVARYRVLGDRWQRRLVEILLTGNYSYRGLEELSVEEFIRLLRMYKSLVFVSVTL